MPNKVVNILFCSALIVANMSVAFSIPSFQQALPGFKYHFPRDHGSHESFKTEWWYYTGHLKTEQGKTFGYELTFFRSNPGIHPLPQKTQWGLKNVYLTHFAISDENRRHFFHTQHRNRSGYGVAGAETNRYHVWNNNAEVRQIGKRFKLTASEPDFGINLLLEAEKPLVIHGQNGVSQKASCKGCASHYYSYTRLKTLGTLREGKLKYSVNGISWMDHEFGSNQLSVEQTGWDWFSIQLNNQTEIMLYQLRLKNGQTDPNSSGSWINEKGRIRHLPKKAFQVSVKKYWQSPETQGRYPMGWKLAIPSQKALLEIQPTFSSQELVAPKNSGLSYWEGSCQVTGTVKGKPVQGQAYVEMTGYAEQFRQKI